MGKVTLPGEDEKARSVPLPAVVAIVAVLSGGASFGVRELTAGGVAKDDVRTIAREEIRAANVPAAADVAVISEKVSKLEQASQTQNDKLDRITNILLERKR
jgi:hypothetical protein